jgi:hypothetical protein
VAAEDVRDTRGAELAVFDDRMSLGGAAAEQGLDTGR